MSVSGAVVVRGTVKRFGTILCGIFEWFIIFIKNVTQTFITVRWVTNKKHPFKTINDNFITSQDEKHMLGFWK